MQYNDFRACMKIAFYKICFTHCGRFVPNLGEAAACIDDWKSSVNSGHLEKHDRKCMYMKAYNPFRKDCMPFKFLLNCCNRGGVIRKAWCKI